MVSIGPVPRAGQDPLIPCSRVYFVNSAVLWMPNPAVNRIHPTAKPVELIERALLNSSKAGDVVSATVKIVCRPVHYYFGFGPSVVCTKSPGRIHFAKAACTCCAVIAAYRFAA